MKSNSAIDKIIENAIAEGKFENLPGEGQPIEWDLNDFSGDDWELAHHLLKENGFAPEFIELRKAIEQDLEQAQKEYRIAFAYKNQSLELGEPVASIDRHWNPAKAKYAQTIETLNKRIADYNLIIPSDQFYRAPIKSK